MKPVLLFPIPAAVSWLMLGLLFPRVLPAQADPHAAWQQAQAVEVPGTGLVRLELPAATLGASLPHLEDLRLLNPQGIESPYVVEWPQPAAVQTQPVAAFRAALSDQKTVLELEPGVSQVIRAVVLTTGAASFIKAAAVEGSNDADQWQPLATNEVIFRQNDGTQRLRLPFAPGSWKHLRVTLNDARSEPVPFTGASFERESPSPLVTAAPAVIPKREETRGHTRLTVPLGAANLWLASLKIQAADPVFSRRVNVLAHDHILTTGTLFRVALEGHEAAALSLPVAAQVEAAEVVLDIENGDSPPLTISGVEAALYPVSLAFHAEAAGHWQLLTGNPSAHAPAYDVAALAGQLRNSASVAATVAALRPNPAFDKSATLPETGTSGGAVIDLHGWAFHAPLITSQRGVMQVELGPEAMAHAGTVFGDVRLVQGGHQLPYLLQRQPTPRKVEVTLTAAPDAQRPGVSRWALKLPLKGMPFTALTATSPTALFSRHLELMEPVRDAYGHPSQMRLGLAAWTQRPGASAPLDMPLNVRATGDTLFLETDNGDNAPLQIDSAAVSQAVVRLLFKTTDPAAIELYYGNPQASTPRYDLSMVEAELRTVAPVNATLGEEARLKAETTRDAEDGGKGSPWLWAALVLVVGGLLWVVARLLPPAQA
ncbi:MAG: hypothetical protein JWO94_2111 [Verrucomicrobiaceae bacterium]|nr:hypothetical protein [Verrucomicrobiaceae bacterium]